MSQKTNQHTSVWHDTLRLLSQRDHTALELREKLRRKSFSTEAIEWAIGRAKELKLIPHDPFSEHELARRWLQIWQRKGKGPLWIRDWLKRKGLPYPSSPPSDELAHQAQKEPEISKFSQPLITEFAEEEWVQNAMTQLDKRFKRLHLHASLPTPSPSLPSTQVQSFKQRAFRFLLSSGYPTNIAQKAIHKWLTTYYLHQGPDD